VAPAVMSPGTRAWPYVPAFSENLALASGNFHRRLGRESLLDIAYLSQLQL